MACARATAAPPTTRPVALTPRRDRRRFWQEKRTTLRLRRNNRVKKVRHVVRFRTLFLFPLSLSLATGTRKGGYPEKDPSPRRNRAPSPPTDQRFKDWPSEGFNSRLKSRGPDTHYWSGVRRRAPHRPPWPP